MESYAHFSLKSLSDFLGDKWEIYEYPIEFDRKGRFCVSAKLEVDVLSIPNSARAIKELFLNCPVIVDEIANYKDLLEASEKSNKLLQEEIKRLSAFESYYNMHFVMKHGNPLNEKGGEK